MRACQPRPHTSLVRPQRSPRPSLRLRSHSTAKMSSGTPLPDIVKELGRLAPLHLAEKWDNVGLLVEPSNPRPINRVLLTNDLTEEVLGEALAKEATLIISYHPPIFEALKQVTPKTTKQRIILRAIENKIAIYSPHTAFDSVAGGINDWLATAFGECNTRPLKLGEGGAGKTLVNLLVDSDFWAKHSASVIPQWGEHAGGVSSSDSKRLTYSASGELAKTSQFTTVSLTLPRGRVSEFVALAHKTIKAAGGSAEVQLQELSPEIPTDTGSGRIASLNKPMTLPAAIEAVKKHLNLPHLRVATAGDKNIRTVALCAGSGASVLKGVKADLYLTGELSHHDVLAAVAQGTHVILTEHSNSERGFLKVLKQKLEESFKDRLAVLIATEDADPLRVM